MPLLFLLESEDIMRGSFVKFIKFVYPFLIYSKSRYPRVGNGPLYSFVAGCVNKIIIFIDIPHFLPVMYMWIYHYPLSVTLKHESLELPKRFITKWKKIEILVFFFLQFFKKVLENKVHCFLVITVTCYFLYIQSITLEVMFNTKNSLFRIKVYFIILSLYFSLFSSFHYESVDKVSCFLFWFTGMWDHRLLTSNFM